MKKKKIGLVIVALITLGIFVYIYLGGLNKVDYNVVNVQDYNLVGEYYRGAENSEGLEDAFFRARDLVLSGEIPGVLTMVHYTNDTTLKEREVKIFVGIKLNKGTSNLPVDYQRLTIPANRAVRANIEAHNIVMPSPKNIESRLDEIAKEMKLRLQDYSIVQYISERKLMIDKPTR